MTDDRWEGSEAQMYHEDHKQREMAAREALHRGCGDNSCLVEKSTGMATNGGCRCSPLQIRSALIREQSAHAETRRRLEAAEQMLAGLERTHQANVREYDRVNAASNMAVGVALKGYGYAKSLEQRLATTTEALRRLCDARPLADAITLHADGGYYFPYTEAVYQAFTAFGEALTEAERVLGETAATAAGETG